MTFWMIAITVVLILILLSLERGNAIKIARAEEERERFEVERQRAEEQREYDAFFAANGYPHHDDQVRVAAWAARRGISLDEATEVLLVGEVEDRISEAMEESSRKRIDRIREHGWQAEYVALAFTNEQRNGKDFRPVHGMIWKEGSGERFFLNLSDLSAFSESECSEAFPLRSRCVQPDTFTIEKEQKLHWDDKRKTHIWIDKH